LILGGVHFFQIITENLAQEAIHEKKKRRPAQDMETDMAIAVPLSDTEEQHVPKANKRRTIISDFEDVKQLNQGGYLVNQILSRRLRANVRRDMEHQLSDYEYLVNWKVYNPGYTTWEPYENVAECRELDKFLDQTPKKVSRKQIKKKATAKQRLLAKIAMISRAKKCIK
jgi:hypothetical protein